jgi:signal transduction histidine kinase
MDALLVVDQYPEFERILWSEAGSASAWVAGPDFVRPKLSASERAELTPLLETARRAEERRMIGPEQGPDGGLRYHVVEPVAQPRAVMVATARVEETLRPLLRAMLGRLDMRIVWDGREIIRESAAADASQQTEGERRTWVELPGGGSWELLISPAPALVRAVITPAAHLVLAGGVLASALLAGLLLAYQSLRQRTRLLERSHQQLDAEAAHTRAAEQALRDLAADLEGRVALRTHELAEAVDELEAFNYSVSHDLRSPLGSILNLTAILEEDHRPALGAGGAELLDRIRHGAGSAIAMMDGLLELSRLGREPLRLVDVDMEGLVRASFEDARISLGARDVRLDLGPLPRAHGDPSLLQIVWTNLLRNALKYSRHREKPQVVVTGSLEASQLEYVVRDNGAGFDMRFAEKLFRPFQRLHSGARFEGSGIGLAVVARVVRRHGGRVWAEGEVEAGASFGFSLPFVPPEEMRRT